MKNKELHNTSKERKNTVLIKFKENIKKEKIEELIKTTKPPLKRGKSAATTITLEHITESLNIAQVSMDKSETENFIKQLEKHEDISYIQEDFKLTPSDFSEPVNFSESSNSWIFAESTAKNEEGFIKNNFGINPLSKDEILKSFDNSEELKIAVLDSGIDTSNKSLEGKFLEGYDFVSMKNHEFSEKDSYHGTQICEIITKVADNLKILPLKFIEDGYGYTSDVIEAINYAKEKDVKIINCSWGSDFYNPILKSVIEENEDILFVCAAGNDGDFKAVYPAAYNLKNVISVTSYNEHGELSSFSSYNKNVNIAAPGENIYVSNIDGDLESKNGTSFSAAFVTGAAALCFSKFTDILVSEVKATLCHNAKKFKDSNLKLINFAMLDIKKALENRLEHSEIIADEEVDPKASLLFNSKGKYSDLDDYEKTLLQRHYFLNKEYMENCCLNGLNISDSTSISYIRQYTGLSFEDAVLAVKNYGNEKEAVNQAKLLIEYRSRFQKLTDKDAPSLSKYIKGGYEAEAAVFSFIVAKGRVKD